MTFVSRLSGCLALCALLVATAPCEGTAQAAGEPSVTEGVFELSAGGEMRYAISVPAGYDDSPTEPRTLILALHPRGRSDYYGSWFMRSIVEPALRGWGAVIVAPDVPDRNWASERAEAAVLELLDAVRAEVAIDPERVLITGFSMGGSGTWYLASRNPDLFTGAIVMAASPREGSVDRLAEMPVYLIHSPDDEVVPYEPVLDAAMTMAGRGYPVQMMTLRGASHGMMGDYVAPLRSAGEWMRERWELGREGSR